MGKGKKLYNNKKVMKALERLSAEWAELADGTAYGKSNEPDKSTKSIKSIKSTKLTKSAKLAKSAKSTKSDKSAKSAKGGNTDLITNAEPAKCAEVVKPTVNKSSTAKSGKYSRYWTKYIEQLNINRDDVDISKWGTGTTNKKILKETGMDFRECYNFDVYEACHIYSHIKLYMDYTVTDLSYDERDFGKFHGTLRQALCKILEGLELFLCSDRRYSNEAEYLKKCADYVHFFDNSIEIEKYSAEYKVLIQAMHLYAEVLPSIWD